MSGRLPTLGNTIVVRERRVQLVRSVTSPDAVVAEVLNNPVATLDPTVTDDVTEGYQVGSWWLNTLSNALWYCVDNTAGAASWSQTNPSGAVTSITATGDGITATPNPIVGNGDLSVQWNAGIVNEIGSGIDLTDGTITATGAVPGVADYLGSDGVNFTTGNFANGLSDSVLGPGFVAIGQADHTVVDATYTFLNSDHAKVIWFTAACAVTLPQAGQGGQFLQFWTTFIANTSSGDVVVTPTVSTIDDGSGPVASITLGPTQTAWIWTGDGVDYRALVGGISGGDAVSGSGTAGQLAVWQSSTVLEGVDFVTALANADLSTLPTSDPGGGKPWLNGGFLVVGSV